MRRWILLLVLLATCLVPRESEALFGVAQVGVGGGVSVPLNDVGDAIQSGWHATAQLSLPFVGSNFGLRGAFNYNQFALDPAAYAGNSGTGELLSGLGNVTFTLPMVGPIHPYATAGIGAFVTKALLDAANVPDPESSTDFGIDVGLGAKFRLFGAHAFVEGTLQNVYNTTGFNNDVVQDFNSQVIPVTLGLTF
jgi:opacity protein-like surface antigen